MSTPDAAASAGAAAIPSGEAAALFKGLKKRDATTKVKALKALRRLVESADKQNDVGSLEPLLGPWAFQFPRLMLEGSRAIRAEACALHHELIRKLGRASLPHLGQVFATWWRAQYDEHPEVAAWASASLRDVFPGPKLVQALARFGASILRDLGETLVAPAASFGDARFDSQSEMEHTLRSSRPNENPMV